MDYRKIIKFGNSSHILSLPKDWLRKNKLKKGDLVYISENGNDELVLSPQLKDENQESEITITENSSIDELHRKLVSSYMEGLMSKLRGFGPEESFLDMWVPDSDHGKSILNMIESASMHGLSTLTIEIQSPEVQDTLQIDQLVQDLNKSVRAEYRKSNQSIFIDIAFGS